MEIEDGPADGRTRDRVRRGVLEQGPVSASHLAGNLGLTPAAVRRHLEALTAGGIVAVWAAPQQHQGRGRPARRYVSTGRGHAFAPTGSDDLAVAALRYVRDGAGDGAVRAFAQQRAGELEQRYRPVLEAAGTDVGRRTQALAGALTSDGYAASVRGGGARTAGVQLCQGSCPVQHVAREFPQLCEAETDVFSRLLGVHVQRLATLASGAHVCTTHVPPRTTPAPDGRHS